MQGDILNQDDIARLHFGAGSFTYADAIATIESIAEGYGEKDLNATKQGTWKAILTESGRALGMNRNTLKREDAKANINETPYDIQLLDILADMFIHFSQRWGKYVTPYAYALWTGIPVDTLAQWECPSRNDLRGVSGSQLRKIVKAREESITDRLYDSNNVTGQIMLANNVLGWDTSRSSQTIEHRTEPTTLEADFSSLGLETGKSVVQIDENTAE